MTRTHLSQFPFALALGLTLASCVAVTVQRTTTVAGIGGPVRPWPASATCPVPARSAADTRRMVSLMNGERAKAGLAPLVLSPALGTVAHAYACEVAARRDIGHTGSDGSSLSERLARGGVAATMVAENNAAGHTSAEAVVAGWMTSPRHRANILRRDAVRVGIGLAGTSPLVWVADFTS